MAPAVHLIKRHALPGRFSIDAAHERTCVVTDLAGMAPHWHQLRSLAAAALEPNVFYEPDMLGPALEAFGSDRLRVVLVYATDPRLDNGSPVLCGCFPLELAPRYRRLPLSALRSWLHPHAFLGTPLVRLGWGEVAVARLFDWLTRCTDFPLLELRQMATDGAVHRLIVNELEARGLSSWSPSQHARALLTHASSDAGTLHAALGRKRVKETQRLGRRLAELGRVEYDQLELAEDVNGWVDEFLALESGGWKGRERTALACDPGQREFFRSIIHTSFANGRLMALSLRLNGRAIAMKCSFVTMGAAFAFKIAYDEGFGKYSPGVLLEIENVRRFDRRADLRWMDSCADPDHSMIDSLWPERRPIETLLVGLGPRAGAAAVTCLPLLRPLVVRWRRWATSDLLEGAQP